MKFTTLVALLGSTTAQLTFCESNADCPSDLIEAGGCCATQTITAVPEDPVWGFIQEGVF